MTEAAAGFRRRVGEVLARMLTSESWSLSVAPKNPALWGHAVTAGGSGAVSWYQRPANGPLPVIYVVQGAVLVQGYLALPTLEWTGSLTRLEKVMAGRQWVRLPMDLVVQRDPGCLPVVWAMQEFSGRLAPDVTELEVEADQGVARYETRPEGSRPDTPATRWELGLNEARITSDGPIDRLELSSAPAACPFRLPGEGEVVDAEEVWAKAVVTAPKRRPPKPKGYQVSFEETEDDDRRFPWTLRDENLAEALGVQNCVEAQELVREALVERIERLDQGVVFDSEGDCFFAYAGSARAAGQLAQLIADLVKERRSAG